MKIGHISQARSKNHPFAEDGCQNEWGSWWGGSASVRGNKAPAPNYMLASDNEGTKEVKEFGRRRRESLRKMRERLTAMLK